MKYDGLGCVGYLYRTGFRQASSGANGKVSDHLGVGGATACFGGGWYIRCSEWNPCIVFGGRLFSLRLCSSGFQDLLRCL
jgi:hypothetical protein